jgi:uncharacterized membrane protein YoaK (UPF0700 family)
MPASAPIPQFELPRSVTVALGLVAGYVDAFTFLGLFGFFIAQMTGSFVYVGTSLASGPALVLAQVLAVPVFFFAGVATTLAAVLASRLERSPLAWALGLECLLLAGMTAVSVAAAPFEGPDSLPGLAVAIFGIAAMGVQSAQVRLMIKGAPSTNVMTTNTTQIAIDATHVALASWRARRRADNDNEAAAIASVRRRLVGVALPMFGFFLGTLAGALAYLAVGFAGLVLPLALMAGLWGWVVRTEPAAR